MEPSPEVFERILVGIDETPQSIEALYQAQRMLAPGGELHLLAVADVSIAVHAGYAAAQVLDEIKIGAQEALARAVEQAGGAGARLVEPTPFARSWTRSPESERRSSRSERTAIAGQAGSSSAVLPRPFCTKQPARS